MSRTRREAALRSRLIRKIERMIYLTLTPWQADPAMKVLTERFRRRHR